MYRGRQPLPLRQTLRPCLTCWSLVTMSWLYRLRRRPWAVVSTVCSMPVPTLVVGLVAATSSSSEALTCRGGGAGVGTGGTNLTVLSVRKMQQQHAGLMRANAMRAADGVQRLLASGGGSSDGVVVVPSGTSAAGLVSGVLIVALAPPVVHPSAPSHLLWKRGEREKFDRAFVFECPAVSRLSAELLARKVFRGALLDQAAALAHNEQEFIESSNDNFLIGMSITCGVVSSADVADQLMSQRTTVSNTNFLSPVAVWVKRYIEDNVSASHVLGVSLGGESPWKVEGTGSSRGSSGSGIGSTPPGPGGRGTPGSGGTASDARPRRGEDGSEDDDDGESRKSDGEAASTAAQR
eukprot:TRINITY_DN5745_c0_g1_i1.p2 TRINITY_DN5745_c0_g1~~TRINITY_DN5745_c0_g1_i1.p2  ORF type:complete len:351 (+),score=27.42 TRINITY_DN5745_c0_g1_i1:1623-2675(+)